MAGLLGFTGVALADESAIQSQILDVTDAEVWVMDPATESWEQAKALKDTDLTRVRGESF